MLPVSNVLAEATASMSVSGTTEVNSEIRVAVTLSGGTFSSANGQITYDSSLFEIVSIERGNFTGSYFDYSIGKGTFSISQATIPSGSTVLVATFKCITSGTSVISCNFGDVADLDVNSQGSPSCSASVTVTEPVQKSDNNNLSSLQVSPGTLSPAFSVSTTSYSISVGENVTKVSVTAVAEDGKASVSLNGVQNNIKPGTNTIKITVTAENGNTKVYSITVTRATGPTGTPTPTPKPLPLMTYLDKELMIIPINENTTVPEGFTVTTATYKGVEIPVFKGPASEGSTDEILLVQLLTEQKVKLFVYDPVEQIVYPFLFIAQKETSFRLLDAGDSIQAPAGYEKFVFIFDGEPVHAYRLISDPDHPQILLYMMNAEGKEVFYYYDTEQEMLFPYRGEVVLLDPTVTPTPSPEPGESTTEPGTTEGSVPSETQSDVTERKSLLENLSDFKSPFTIMFYLIALIALVLAAAVISLMIRRRTDYEDDYEDDYLPEDESVPPMAVYPSGRGSRIQDPDDVFEENYGAKNNRSEADYIPPIVRVATAEKPVEPLPQTPVNGKNRPVADAVPVMGVRKVQLGSIPELAEPIKDLTQPVKAPAPSPSAGSAVPLASTGKPETQTSAANKPETQVAPAIKPEVQPAVAPKVPSKTDNPIPEHIPVRLKLELDEQMNKEQAAEQLKKEVQAPAKATGSVPPQAPNSAPEKSTPVSQSPTADPAKPNPAPSDKDSLNVNTPPVTKAPPIQPKAPEFGFKYVPGEIDKHTTSAKEAPSLDFPDIRRKSEPPEDPDLE